MTVKTKVHTITLNKEVDTALAQWAMVAKRSEVAGKVIFDGLVSETKEAVELLKIAIPAIGETAGEEAILLKGEDGAPLLQFQKARAVTTLELERFLYHAMRSQGLPEKEVAQALATLQYAGLFDVLSAPATAAKKRFSMEYEASSIVEHSGSRTLKVF